MPRVNTSLFTEIDNHISMRLAAMGGSCPGNVVSYDEDTETATVQLGVHRLLPLADDPDQDEVEEHPPVYSVPVAWPRARGYSVVGSLQAGDPVLLVACPRDISGWRRTGKPAAPGDARLGGSAGVVAIPGLEAAVSGFPTPSDAAALASKLDTLIGIILGALAAQPLPGTPPGPPGTGDWSLFQATVALYFPAIASKPATPAPADITTDDTTGSAILKLEE